jgi:hypothetical protein
MIMEFIPIGAWKHRASFVPSKNYPRAINQDFSSLQEIRGGTTPASCW